MSIDQVPPWLWGAIVLLWMVLSIAYRRLRGKPLVAYARPGSVFVEGWASGRVGTGLLARLGTARNCMHVQATPTELRIHPHFPFTLGFMPEIYDLDQVITLGPIRSATIQGGNRAKTVEPRYVRPGGDVGTVQLLLRKAELFIAAVSAPERDAAALAGIAPCHG